MEVVFYHSNGKLLMQDYIQNLKMLEKEKRNSSRLSLEDKQKNGQMLSIEHFLGSPASLWEVTHVETVVPRDTHSTHKYIFFQTSVVHQNQDFKRFIAVYFIFLAVIFFFQMKSHPLGLR